jgi:hypothetical protein
MSRLQQAFAFTTAIAMIGDSRLMGEDEATTARA